MYTIAIRGHYCYKLAHFVLYGDERHFAQMSYIMYNRVERMGELIDKHTQ